MGSGFALSMHVGVPGHIYEILPPSTPNYRSWMQAPKTLRDRTVTVDALAAHKSNNIDHVFTLPSLRNYYYYVTARQYIQWEHIRVHRCTPMCKLVVTVRGTISGKIRGKCTIYRVTYAHLYVRVRTSPLGRNLSKSCHYHRHPC